MHRGTEVKAEIKQVLKIRNCKIRRIHTGVGCVFSVRAALTYYIFGRIGLMLRRQIRMCREFPAANELTFLSISGLFGYKNTNLRRVLKKYTQAR
jgi:hypothetical protein